MFQSEQGRLPNIYTTLHSVTVEDTQRCKVGLRLPSITAIPPMLKAHMWRKPLHLCRKKRFFNFYRRDLYPYLKEIQIAQMRNIKEKKTHFDLRALHGEFPAGSSSFTKRNLHWKMTAIRKSYAIFSNSHGRILRTVYPNRRPKGSRRINIPCENVIITIS